MSDVASRPFKDSFEQPPSGFTAVNGRSSPPEPPAASPTRSPPLQNGDNSHYNNYAISNKRKRSGSAEPSPPGTSQSPPRTSHPNSTYDPTGKTPAIPASERPQSNDNGSPQDSHVPRYVSPGDHHWSNPDDIMNQDAHIAEALKRGTEQLPDARQSSSQPLSPEAQPHAPGSQMNQNLPGPGMIAHKQRKRNFSNRTKTGCLTCRQRKKKCDEAKPTCKNCERGNFDCLGYQNQNQTFKTPAMASQPQLQAKNGVYFDPVPPPPQQQAPSHPQGVSAAQAQPQYGYPSRPMQPPSGPPMPPMYPGYHATPERDPARSRLPLGGPPPQPPPSHEAPPFGPTGSDGHPRPYHRSPWPDHAPPTYAPAPDSRPVASLPPEPEPPKTLPGLPSMAGMRHNSNDMQAQFYASQSLNRLGDNRPFQVSHKSNMLEGKPFWAGDAKLVEDRNYCRRILHKWNQNALDPDLWVDSERTNKFRAMLRERREAAGRHEQEREAVGDNVSIGISFDCTYGYNITVGSNTQIGNGCRFGDCGRIQIGKDCTIRDNVIIMTELATAMSSGARDAREPLSKPVHITIEDGVYIGDNVQITPDQLSLQSGNLRIGRNAQLQAGSVVVHDVSSHMDAWRTNHGTVIKGNYSQQK